MKDYANKNSLIKRSVKYRKKVYGAKKKSLQVVSSKVLLSLFITSLSLAAISFFYFETDVKNIETRNDSNNITIDFPSSLLKGSVLIESSAEDRFLFCEYFVQIGAYGNKKYAYEAKEILKDIKLISINEIYSSSDPGKKLHSVLSGPYANRSAANNSKEVITKKGFEPRLRTICKEK